MDSDVESVIEGDAVPRVACLCSVEDLTKEAQSKNVKISQETNSYMVYLLLRKLGAPTAKKLIQKLADKGEFAWDKEEDFEVESIIDYGIADTNKEMYLIKWKGWSHNHNSWEPKENLTGCDSFLKDFHERTKLPLDRNDLRTHYSEQKVQQESKMVSSAKMQIDDIFAKITDSKPSITPLELLSLQSPLKKQLRKKGRDKVKRLFRPPKHISDLSKRSNAYKKLKKEQQIVLKQWEKKLNSINTDPAGIHVENEIDLEGPPDNFVFITDYLEGQGVSIPQDPIVGCECEDCYSERKTCCGVSAGSEFAYYKKGRVRMPPGTPIYECNKRCKCGPSCDNRVVQHGRRHRVCIFRTSNNRGWGVKAMQLIKKGSFVMEYIGEVLTNEEAERRGKEYDLECRTYLFDLDYNDDDCPFTVDAGVYGNVSHFVNHSCDPNLAVYGVWINSLDPRLPRICLFAKKDIKKGEELTFDYMMTGDTTSKPPLQPGSLVLPETDAENKTGDTEKDIKDLNESELRDVERNEVKETDIPLTPVSEPEHNTPILNQSHEDMEISDDVKSDITTTTTTTVVETDALEKTDESKTLDEMSNADYSEDSELSSTNMFFRRKVTSPSPAMKFRITCQCGAANCRKYLF